MLTTNSAGKDNVFCPGEHIVVKCSVKGPTLHWHIGNTSFAIPQKRNITFSAGPNKEGLHTYMNTAIGRLDFYQNATYIGSNGRDSSIDSELHMHLSNPNNFVDVICEDNFQMKKKISITFLHGRLNFRG